VRAQADQKFGRSGRLPSDAIAQSYAQITALLFSNDGQTTRSRYQAVVMNGGARRKTGAGRLRDPPGLAHPRVVASHHVIANIIHEQGANLRRNVNRPGVRKRPLKRICFHSISPGNGLARRPGVKQRGAVAGRYQAVPNLALPRRLIGIGRSGFYWPTDERLNGG